MAKGFWNFIKKVHKVKQETLDEHSENYINNNFDIKTELAVVLPIPFS